MPKRDYDERLLRESFKVARRAREGGDHPFGSVLADKSGKVLREQGNGYSAEGGDRTAHAEKLLASWAAKNLSLDELQECTLYSSAEPCAMCSGAIYWAGIGRVVYALSEARLLELTGAHDDNPTLYLPCRDVFACGQRATAVTGPLIEDEAVVHHQGFWN